MRTTPRSSRADQLTLFQVSPGGPRWEQLPPEVRQQTIRWLARMLSEHAEREMVSTSMQEASDE